MRNLWLMAAALMMVGATGAVAAEQSFYDGNTLLSICPSGGSEECFAFVAGVSDLLGPASDRGESINGWRACIPAEVTLGQEAAVVRKFLRDHPERLHITAAALVERALAEAFPCKGAAL